MPAKFVVYLDKANKFRFDLKAANGETLAVSESFPDKKAALKGIAAVAKNAPVAVIDDTTAPKLEKAKPAAKTAAKPKAKPAAKTTKKPAAKPKAKAKAAPKPKAPVKK